MINALEADEHVRIVVFDSAVEDYFLNHSHFMAKRKDLTSMPPSLQSMDKIAGILAKKHTKLWTNHDQPQSDAQKKLPAYYE